MDQHYSDDSANSITAASATGSICDVEELHRLAVQRGEFTYEDPMTGFTVFTELAHLKRGKCCGNMCRHCPFGWVNVPGLQVSKLRPQQTTNDTIDTKDDIVVGKGGKFGGSLTKKNVPYTRTGKLQQLSIHH